MARKKGRKRNFDPLRQPAYKTRGQFNKTVRKRARSKVQPQLNDVNQRLNEAQQAHQARNLDLGSWYGFETAARKAADDRLAAATGQITSSLASAGSDVQGAMAAALRQQADRQGQEYTALGVEAPGMDPALQSAVAAYSSVGNMGLAGDIAGARARSAADIGISGVAGRQAATEEQQRYNAERQGLLDQRSDIRGLIPGLMSDARSELLNEALQASQNQLAFDQFGETKRTNRFNERMGRRQQRLAESQFGETKRQNRANERLARRQARLAEAQLKADIDTSIAQGNTENAQAVAKQFDGAVQWLDSYMAPTGTGKNKEGPKKRARRLGVGAGGYQQALQQIMTRFGLSEKRAHMVMLTASEPTWRQHAEKILDGYADVEAGLNATPDSRSRSGQHGGAGDRKRAKRRK